MKSSNIKLDFASQNQDAMPEADQVIAALIGPSVELELLGLSVEQSYALCMQSQSAFAQNELNHPEEDIWN